MRSAVSPYIFLRKSGIVYFPHFREFFESQSFSDDLLCAMEALSQSRLPSGDDESRCCVQAYDLRCRPLCTGKNIANNRGILFRRSAAEILQRGGWNAQLFRQHFFAADFSILEDANMRSRADAQFI